MEHVLNIKANSEAEEYFKQLIKEVDAKNVKVSLSQLHNGVLCNDYTIDGETFNAIKNHIKRIRG